MMKIVVLKPFSKPKQNGRVFTRDNLLEFYCDLIFGA